ncbi:hypothetical protein [Streptomyces mirabilis]|uniref:hypothetical protein n=1 Tax=Streptomyces mirabilis TaxID=68239 RepID=UPI002257FEC8|nr:hypothetical protein [Streptomyces mirabilis]MCX4429449.1 hypothetical protein [Streptomyces mirabilis]
MTGRRWFENQALAVAAAVAVAVGLYVWRGGHYPLPVDLMALTAVALVVYTGARQLTLARTTDTKENDPMTAPVALEIPNFDRSWHPNEIGDWLSQVEDDESVSHADLTRARQAVAVALGVDDADAGA